MRGAAYDLPGTPPPVLLGAYEALDDDYRAALRMHLLSWTSSETIAHWFARAGQPVGSRTIRRYRESLPEGSV